MTEQHLSYAGSLPNWPQRPELADPKPGAPCTTPTWEQGPKDLDHLSLLSHEHWQGVGQEMEQLGFKLEALWDTDIAARSITYHSTSPATLIIIIIFKVLFYLKSRVRGKGREIFHSLDYFPTGHNSQG